MGRKSLVQRSEVDYVLKAHNCQSSQKHRLLRGEKRLKVWKDRSADHYCVACALAIIERDIAFLQKLAEELRAEPAPTAVAVSQDGSGGAL